MTTQTEDVLVERGSRYGTFTTHAQITMTLKNFWRSLPSWYTLSMSQQESLDMIAHKIGRIINVDGDPNYSDSWIDIAGYATLVAQELDAPSTSSEEGNPQAGPDTEVEGVS